MLVFMSLLPSHYLTGHCVGCRAECSRHFLEVLMKAFTRRCARSRCNAYQQCRITSNPGLCRASITIRAVCTEHGISAGCCSKSFSGASITDHGQRSNSAICYSNPRCRISITAYRQQSVWSRPVSCCSSTLPSHVAAYRQHSLCRAIITAHR